MSGSASTPTGRASNVDIVFENHSLRIEDERGLAINLD
jgi:hypothetical protein